MKPLPKNLLLALYVCLLFSCSQYDRDPDLRLARDFIDAYYVMADQQKALKLTAGRAETELKKEMALVKDVAAREDAYRSRDIVFDLKRSDKSDAEVSYFFELRIIQPELGESKQMIHLVVDRKLSRIKDYRNIQ